MKQAFVVEGGVPLCGAIELPAAKNSILPLLAAALLCDAPVTFSRVPALSDVSVALGLLNTVGCMAVQQEDVVCVRPGAMRTCVLPTSLTSKMRASVLFLAPVLSRYGRVETGMCGGCRIGARPIDIHLDGLIKMGARVCWGKEQLVLTAPKGLCGVDYTLRYPSVGATETLLMAAVKANGITVLRGVACEPEIIDLADFLNACGANVSGAGTSVICISGVSQLGGTQFAPLPDRIVGATIACAVASAGGSVCIQQAAANTFLPVLEALRRAGCEVQFTHNNEVWIAREGALSGIGHLSTGVYPAFPTDAAPLLAAALLCARSQSSIEDAVFENRFSCANGFAAMGARVAVSERALAIAPCQGLQGASVFAPDLRGGAALVIAALSAQGVSEIGEVTYISRGYADFAKMMTTLGGKITEKNTENH